jgi:hypothetical protein
MEPVFLSVASQVEGRGKNLGANFMRVLLWWRRWRLRFSHFSLEFLLPGVGAAEVPGGGVFQLLPVFLELWMARVMLLPV